MTQEPTGLSPGQREEDTATEQQTTEPTVASSVTWERLEACLRGRMRQWIQDLLEAEVDKLLGRRTSARRKAVDGVRGTGAGAASRGG